jgi:hypothetical protein
VEAACAELIPRIGQTVREAGRRMGLEMPAPLIPDLPPRVPDAQY